MHELLQAASDNLPAILADIDALVRVETNSYDLAALSEGLDTVRSIAIAQLGEPTSSTVDDGGEHGSVLQMTYAGTGPGHVVIVAHYDTVWPTGTLAEWPAGPATDAAGRETITGPGIFDMKTGLIQGIWALKLLQDGDLPRPTVTFVFNGDEEIGSLASRPIIEAAARQADAALVLEATAGGAIKTQRKGVGLFAIEVTGVEAHAGLNPTAGASAIHAIAEVVTAATKIANLDAGTSVNVGLIEGGSGTNVAAGRATAKVDIRIESTAEMNRVDSEFDAITVSDPRASVTVKHDWNRPPMTFTAANQRLLSVVQSASSTLGRELKTTAVGGASDANFISALDIPVICGLGAVGDGAHARNEFIYPDEVPHFTALTALTMQELAEGLAS